MKKSSVHIIAAIITILLFVAATGYWFNHQVVNSQQFTVNVRAALLTDDSKRAISNEIVDKGLQNRPLIRQLIGDQAKSAVYSLLNTQYFQSNFNNLAANVHTRLMTNKSSDLSIDITTIKSFALPLLERLTPQLANNLNARQIPNTIVIIQQRDVPTIQPYVMPILWGGWISLMVMIVLLCVYFYKSSNISQSLKILGGWLVVTFVFITIAIVTIQPVLSASVTDPNLHTVAEKIIEVFTTSLLQQMRTIIGFGLIIFAVGFIYPYAARTAPKIMKIIKPKDQKESKEKASSPKRKV